jgi:hypothetical protein
MGIQINQEFPHCARCGIMVHTRSFRIVASDNAGEPVVFCSELCRDEYAELVGLSSEGEGAKGLAPR